jgi:tetratricopeptide (TPR) repeat protein
MANERPLPSWVEEARSHLERADELYHAGQFQPALIECNQGVELDPLLAAEGYMLSGRLLTELGRPREALVDYRKALRAGGRSAEAGQIVAGFAEECLAEATRLYEEGDDTERVLAYCEVALEVDAGCAEAHNLHGLLLEESGETARASVCYRRAIALDPECSSAIENLARLEEDAGQTGEEAEPDDAELDFEAVPGAREEEEAEAIAGAGQEADDWADSDGADRATRAGTGRYSQWLAAFGRVLFKPSVATFQELAIRSDASVLGCVAWLAVASAVFTLFDILVLRYLPLAAFSPLAYRTTLVLVLICFRMLVNPGLVMLFVFLVDSCQRWLFRRHISYYRELVYIVTVVYIALLFASKVLALIPVKPVVGLIITGVIYAYLLLLTGMAVRGITGLSVGKAAATVIYAAAVMFALLGGLRLLGELLLANSVP